MDRYINDCRCGTYCRDGRTGETVLVTNSVCVLAHDSVANYHAAHRDGGCLYRPWEGFVFVLDANGDPTGYRFQHLSPDREYKPVPEADRERLRDWYLARMNELAKDLRRRKH